MKFNTKRLAFVFVIAPGISTFAEAQTPAGEATYTTPGTYQWTCPAGVTNVSVVCVGGGSSYQAAGGGGGLGWKNNLPVVPGNSYAVVVGAANNTNGSYFVSPTTVGGRGAYMSAGGTFVGDGGGNGGVGLEYGGGGAGGYTGNGGNGGVDNGEGYGGTTTGGAGGGGGGGACLEYYTFGNGGGGVGLFGQGANGAADILRTWYVQSSAGGGGSGGGAGSPTKTAAGGNGGNFGGGAGGSRDEECPPGAAGTGAVRIIWGAGRAFPSTNTLSMCVITSSSTAAAASGYPFSYQITTSPTASSYGAIGLPAGLTLNPVTGLISGTTNVVGSCNVSLTATNAGGTCPATTLVLTVVLPTSQVITFGPLSATKAGTPLVLAATASSGLPVVFSIVSGPATVSGNVVTLNGAGTVTIAADQAGNVSYSAAPRVMQSVTVTMPPAGQVAFTTPGTYPWTCPPGVTSVSVVCVGGGGGGGNRGGSGGGGELRYRNNIPVVPGNSYSVIVGAGGAGGARAIDTVYCGTSGGYSSFNETTVIARGGWGGYLAFSGGSPGRGGTGDGGGDGGWGVLSGQAGGGGAGGYSGAGGNGGSANTNGDASMGGGGGGGGGGNQTSYYSGAGGGGVGLFGQGASGNGGAGNQLPGEGGAGGSGGVAGGQGYYNGAGGAYGGGGGSGGVDGWADPGPVFLGGGKGGDGAVRIIYGAGRAFPVSSTQDMFSPVITSASVATPRITLGESLVFSIAATDAGNGLVRLLVEGWASGSLWTAVSDNNFGPCASKALSPTFTPSAVGNYQFRLRATNNQGVSTTGEAFSALVEAAPTFVILGGDNQTTIATRFNPQPFDIAVWNSEGSQPLTNRRVTFSVLEGGGLLAATNSGNPVLSASLERQTDADGTVQVYYKQPGNPYTLSKIRASAGLTAVTLLSQSTVVGDADGNGLQDAWETAKFGSNHPFISALADPDEDGLNNGQEYLCGTDPLNRDSDGDGLSDGVEATGSRDPMDKHDEARWPADCQLVIKLPGNVYRAVKSDWTLEPVATQ